MTNLPHFATNRPANAQSVAQEVNRLFAILRETYKLTPEIAIATAYINPGGFQLLADELEKAPRVRLLLGAEPDELTVQSVAVSETNAREKLAFATESHESWLLRERDITGFTHEALSDAKRLVDWLRSVDPEGKAKVEVKRFTEGFLHGKAYISANPNLPAVLAGSSNMTYAGLKLNAELNLGYPAGDQHHVKSVVDWFEEYWEKAETYDLAAVYEEIWQEHSPWDVFLRMLYELYGAVLQEEAPGVSKFDLTAFQRDGISRMKRLLEANGGVIVADEVGLGKTYLAGEVIYEATEERRQRVLLICPAALKESMWEPFLRTNGFRLTDVKSYDEVRTLMSPDHPWHVKFTREMGDYAMVVIDEAHNLRNSAAERSKAIDRVILEGKYAKQVVLLTATPVNNSLQDLDTLVRYFIRDDAQFAHVNIPSIKKYIRDAQDLDSENLSPDHLFELMDQVAVRRTRKFVKEHYPNEFLPHPYKKGELVPIKFPTPRVSRIDYQLSQKGEVLVDAVLAALELGEHDDLYSAYHSAKADPDRLMLARYTPSRYKKTPGGVERIQIQNAGLLRSALLKRLESSPRALQATLSTLINSHELFLKAIEENGLVLEGEALRAWVSSDSDDLEDVISELDDKGMAKVKPASDFYVEALLADTKSDLSLLQKLLALCDASLDESDTKFDELVAQLETIAIAAARPHASGVDEGDRRKVIVFSSYTDTVIDIHDRLKARLAGESVGQLAPYAGRLAEPQSGSYSKTHKAGKSGGFSQGGRADVIAGFAPKTAGAKDDDGVPLDKDKYDILITTDVLAEGVNLQQAGQIINYDLPWNPMRIVQRHGRIDRLFSEHDEVHLGLFFPAEHLDQMLRLQETLERKLAQAEAALGSANVLPGRETDIEVIFHDLENVEQEFENLLENRGAGSALSGEEFRRRLFAELDGHTTFATQLKRLPYGIGSGFINPRSKTNGWVFCVKIGDHPDPWFRYVLADNSWQVAKKDGAPLVYSEQLLCLSEADPQKKSTERVLPEAAYSGAFEAWQAAQAEIYDRWKFLVDPQNLYPELPKSFLDASEFVMKHGQHLGLDSQATLLARLRSVPSNRVSRAMRKVLNESSDTKTTIENMIDLLDYEGIREAKDPQPLPPVSLGEVRLVAWMAVGRP